MKTMIRRIKNRHLSTWNKRGKKSKSWKDKL